MAAVPDAPAVAARPSPAARDAGRETPVARYRSTVARFPRRARRRWRRSSWAATPGASEAAIRAERKRRLQEALERMDADRPRSAGAAALRAALQRRVARVLGSARVGGDQALYPGLETAQGRYSPPCRAGRRRSGHERRIDAGAGRRSPGAGCRVLPGPVPSRRAAGTDRADGTPPRAGRADPRVDPGAGRAGAARRLDRRPGAVRGARSGRGDTR